MLNREWLEPWEATTPAPRPFDAGRGYGDAVRALAPRCAARSRYPVRAARRRPVRRAGDGRCDRARLGELGVSRLLDRASRLPAGASCRPRWRWSSTIASAHAGLHRRRGEYQARECREPAGGREAGLSARGHPRAVHPYRRRVARSPVVRAHGRGCARGLLQALARHWWHRATNGRRRPA